MKLKKRRWGILFSSLSVENQPFVVKNTIFILTGVSLLSVHTSIGVSRSLFQWTLPHKCVKGVLNYLRQPQFYTPLNKN